MPLKEWRKLDSNTQDQFKEACGAAGQSARACREAFGQQGSKLNQAAKRRISAGLRATRN
jgi:hypothetical protein